MGQYLTVRLWQTFRAWIGNYSHKTLFTLCRTVNVLRLSEPQALISLFPFLALGKRSSFFDYQNHRHLSLCFPSLLSERDLRPSRRLEEHLYQCFIRLHFELSVLTLRNEKVTELSVKV